jgi:predicted transcriptional regulator
MQMQLPLFPPSTKLINNTVGVYQEGDMVYYLHNGSPIFCHGTDDMNNYRYIVANLVETHLCKPSEISKALGVGLRNIQRYSKDLREKGTDWFFNREDNRGKCFKLTEEKMETAQEQLNENTSISQIARNLNVTEAAIRYHIRTGKLKKK